MPLVTATVLAYAAGLFSGFGGAFVWTAAAALFVVWTGGRIPRERIALFAIAVAGFAIASSSRAIVQSCVDRLTRQRAWELTLDGDAAPGSFVRARHSCGATVRISVRRGPTRSARRPNA